MEIATRRREQEVWQACDDLWALHGEIGDLTGDNIRDRLLHLGKSRGSPNELYKYRKTWLKSRGINGAVIPSMPSGELDPISRAVKLVHEQLKAEALEESHRLKEECQQLLKEKDEEVLKAKTALDAIMVEFNDIHQRYSEQNAAVLSLKSQLAAETEVRRAAEREVALNRSLREQEIAAHNTLMNEIKTLHAQQLTSLDSAHKARVQQQESMIDKLAQEKKDLGAEFSDKLNEVRTLSYNQEIKIKLLESKLVDAQTDAKKLSTTVIDKGNEVDALKLMQARSIEALQSKTKELALLSEKIGEHDLKCKELNNALKKAQVTIARLRAMLSPRGVVRGVQHRGTSLDPADSAAG